VLPEAKARIALKMFSELESVADVRALFKSQVSSLTDET